MDIADLAGRAAVVTGAASGIGRETTLAFARRGAGLFLCDVDETGLAETERGARELGCEVTSRRVDVASREEMGAFADSVHERVEAVDLLVNNAGVAIGGGFLDTGLDDWEWILGINLTGVVHGCHFFAPAMVKRGSGGHIVNISSMAGYVASEVLAAYATTKFAVLGLSEALRDELSRHGIGVTAVCPGIINTPITGSARMRGAVMERPEARTQMIEAYQRRNYGPERVAENILKAIARNRAVAPISPEAWVGYYLKRMAPWMMRWFNKKLGERGRRQAAHST
jgi:NAD(P)-dependent dehydrogenase (short-subunit alcohol dehydrogenase family)